MRLAAFNRTTLELKLVNFCKSTKVFLTFNRTTLELK